MRDEGISINGLAQAIRVPANRISLIVNGKRGITADTAARLGRYFGTSAQYWLNIQNRFDLDSIDPGHDRAGRDSKAGSLIPGSQEALRIIAERSSPGRDLDLKQRARLEEGVWGRNLLKVSPQLARPQQTSP